MDLDKQIEALLFWKGEPMTIQRLGESLKRPPEDIEQALVTLQTTIVGRGVVLQRNGDEVTLGTAPDASALIEALAKEELNKELSKAAVETLAIILYKGPIRRSEIDFIRGVNSTFILRNLLIRGLIEKVSDPKDERVFLYTPTFELLSNLGISKAGDLPEFAKVQEEIDTWRREAEKTESPEPETAPTAPEIPTAPAPEPLPETHHTP